MAGTRECNSAVTAGRLSKAVELLDAAEHLGGDMPSAAGDLLVDAGIARDNNLSKVRLPPLVQPQPTLRRTARSAAHP